MVEQRPRRDPEFKVVCISCGVKIRENASDDSYGMCLRCFYTMQFFHPGVMPNQKNHAALLFDLRYYF